MEEAGDPESDQKGKVGDEEKTEKSGEEDKTGSSFAPAEDVGAAPGSVDFYISYREKDPYGYSDWDVASKIASVLQKEKRSEDESVSVFLPDGHTWQQRVQLGLGPAKNVLLVVSEDGLRRIYDAHRSEDVMLLEYEYALAEKLKGLKRVLLILLQDKTGSKFSSFGLDNFAHGEVAKVGQPPCHKSTNSARLWDNGEKGDLLFKERKAGEHSVRETMAALFRLTGRHTSSKPSELKTLVPEMMAMLMLKMPQVPTERSLLSKNVKLEQEGEGLRKMFEGLGEETAAVLPLLKMKFGIGSIHDLSSLSEKQLEEELEVDSGKIVLFDKSWQVLFIENTVSSIDDATLARTVSKLKLLGLEAAVPDAEQQEQLSEKMCVTALFSTSGANIIGKRMEVGGEERMILSATDALVLRNVDEVEGTSTFVEVTDDLLAKLKNMKELGERYKGPAVEVPPGRPHLMRKVTLSAAVTKENEACFDGKPYPRDSSNSKELCPYRIVTKISKEEIRRILRATQTSLGISAGGVCLAQTFSKLFDHRIKKSDDQIELNHELMQSIKEQNVKKVIDLLQRGASANFKEEVTETSGKTVSWTPLIRACSVRVDTGDLGRNVIACNQIIDALVRAGADVNQTNDYGRTALHYAAMEGNYTAVMILVHAGAPVDAKDKSIATGASGVVIGANAAYHAKMWKKNEWEKVVQLLELYSNEKPPSPNSKPTPKSKGKKKKK